MISVIGITLLSLSLIGFGLSYNSALRAEKTCLEELISLCERIYVRIDCFKQPLPEIFRDFSSPYLDSCGFSAVLKEKGLKTAFADLSSALPLSQRSAEIIAELSYKLGNGYASEELRLCARAKNELKAELASLNKTLPDRMKLSLTLSCAAAAMAAILFI